MTKANAVKLAALLTGSALLVGITSGCAWSVGGKKTECCPAPPTVSKAPPTRGQELIDLKKARDQGAITEEEYSSQKKKILDK
jgi:hypothetical protein